MSKFIFSRAIKFFLAAASITVLSTIITFVINPDTKEVIDGIRNHTPSEINESAGILKVWSYVTHNGFAVPFQMFLLALIPIQFLYSLNIVSTSALLGVAFGIALQIDTAKGTQLIISSIPHTIFEIFAYCILAAVLFELNQAIRGKLKNLWTKEKKEFSLIEKFLKTISIYVVYVIPFIIAAAFLETYLADLILQTLQ